MDIYIYIISFFLVLIFYFFLIFHSHERRVEFRQGTIVLVMDNKRIFYFFFIFFFLAVFNLSRKERVIKIRNGREVIKNIYALTVDGRCNTFILQA